MQTYGDYFEEFRRHPESKLADSDGKPCHPWSRGALHPRYVTATSIVRLGKESTRLTTGRPIEEGAQLYRERARCGECRKQLADLRARYCSGACRQRAYRKRVRSKGSLAGG